MSFDCSRFSFDAWKDFLGVVMQQGRVQLDADWNEWVSQVARRLQAGTLDTIGRAVVPRETPDGFRIEAAGGALTIGHGRIYVDGLLAENHGGEPLQWEPALAELTGSAPLPFFAQPYLPFNAANITGSPFNRPQFSAGPHLVYLDVWQREVTHLQYPELVEKAVGVDTTGRLQTVWQVQVLENVGAIGCATEDENVPRWQALIRPSGGRLSTATAEVTGEPDPCHVPPSGGYQGLENQLYRVAIQEGGAVGTATFKWSRDNGTVAARVTALAALDRLVVDSVGRDEVLRFNNGDRVEITDDWRELHGLPGILGRIRLGNGVDDTARTISLEQPLSAGLFPVDAQGNTDPTRHTRIHRWDQHGQVRRGDGTLFHDLDSGSSTGAIPVPPAGVAVLLEDGIVARFDLEPAGSTFKTGDYWVFAARTADASIEQLDRAPPRGIHHHYARLALVTFPNAETDCRILWPPINEGESCDCTVCVSAAGHNAGVATLQHAIDSVRETGGTVCLGTGIYQLNETLSIDQGRSLRIRGQGWRTILLAAMPGPVVAITQGLGITVENLSIVGASTEGGATGVMAVENTIGVRLERLAVLGIGSGNATVAAVALSGYALAATLRDCVFLADRGVVNGTGQESNYLLTANLGVSDNLFWCEQRGVSLERQSLHYGDTRIAGNLFLNCRQAGIVATGGVFPGSAFNVLGNTLQVGGDGIQAGVDELRIGDNDISRLGEETQGNGIVLAAGLDPGGIDHVQIVGNRILRLANHGIVIQTHVNSGMIKQNVIDGVGGGGLIVEAGGGAGYLSIENNQFLNLGVGFNTAGLNYAGMRLFATDRVDVSGNVFSGVALDAVQSRSRQALQLIAVAEARLAGNRLHGIGPVGQFAGEVVGIAVIPPFAAVQVVDNAVARAADDAELGAGLWWALQARRLSPDDQQAQDIVAPNLGFLILDSANVVLLTATHLHFLARRPGELTVHGNRFSAQVTTSPLVEIDGAGTCLFTENHCIRGATLTGAAMPLAVIQNAAVNASHNRLQGAGDVFTLLLSNGPFAVLGNLSSGPILVNGKPLPEPWAALNVHAS